MNALLQSLICQPLRLRSERVKELTNERLSFNVQPSTFNLYLGGYSAEVPPLPIPNRVVKLSIADGTALRCGRVGSRHFERVPLGTLFFCVYATLLSPLVLFLDVVGLYGLGLDDDRGVTSLQVLRLIGDDPRHIA